MKRGISLIVLVITIVVIIILSGTVILNLSKNNPIESARVAKLMQEKETYDSSMTIYSISKMANSLGKNSIQDIITGKISSIPSMVTDNGIQIKGKILYLAEENNIKQELGISISNSNKSKWYVEVSTGKFYLIYDDKSNYEKYLGKYNEDTGELENSSLASFVMCKNMASEIVNEPEYSDYIESKGVNKPRLVQGMTPIKWDAGGNVVETNENDPDWYDYTNKKWANVKTQDGSMWVWIPRYEYKIPTLHTQTAQTILVNFLKDKSTNITSGYNLQPAFKFGDDELTGFWVAKFEASGSLAEVNFKTDQTSLRGPSISDMFTASRNLEKNNRYGWGTTGNGFDTHLTKNIEWGAIAYLSNSIYGKNSEIWVNCNANYITGQVATSVSNMGTSTTYSYNNLQYGFNGSTTGTIYGIYDISGGAYELTSAYVNTGEAVISQNGQSLLNADPKYVDVYQPGSDMYSETNYDILVNKIGDALYETSISGDDFDRSWNEDQSWMVSRFLPFFKRGGSYSNHVFAGAFAFWYTTGEGYTLDGFRSVIAVDDKF